MSESPAPDSLASPPAKSGRRRRPNRFNRPKEPRDWRWAVGTLGRILICIGMLMFAFVAYQLWGTGIQTAQAQRRLENDFEAQLETATTTPPVTTVAPPPTTTTAPPVDSVPDATVPIVTNPPVIPTTTLPPPVIELPESGDPLAKLEVPSIGLDWIVVSGVSSRDLQDGPGHFPETPLPGQVGNSAIAGHRTTHGAPFRKIDKIDVGDDIILTTLAGRFVYVVTDTKIVKPGDYAAVVPARDARKATVTLVSCNPEYSTRERIVVHAELDPARSGQITNASPPRPSEGSELPGDSPDTTVLPPGTSPEATVSTEPGSTDPATTEQGSTVSGSTVPGSTVPGGTDPASGEPDTETSAPTEVSGEPAGAELFESGWFSDPDAWPQVIAWGLLLTLIVVGAELVCRRFKRNWVGILVGIVPFVVVLYFWFENVNRLLPPGL